MCFPLFCSNEKRLAAETAPSRSDSECSVKQKGGGEGGVMVPRERSFVWDGGQLSILDTAGTFPRPLSPLPYALCPVLLQGCPPTRLLPGIGASVSGLAGGLRTVADSCAAARAPPAPCHWTAGSNPHYPALTHIPSVPMAY